MKYPSVTTTIIIWLDGTASNSNLGLYKVDVASEVREKTSNPIFGKHMLLLLRSGYNRNFELISFLIPVFRMPNIRFILFMSKDLSSDLIYMESYQKLSCLLKLITSVHSISPLFSCVRGLPYLFWQIFSYGEEMMIHARPSTTSSLEFRGMQNLDFQKSWMPKNSILRIYHSPLRLWTYCEHIWGALFPQKF